MDFSYHYTEEQRRFRQEVATWLADNISSRFELSGPALPDDATVAEQIRQTLGEKGWLAPADPPELGGAGLGSDLNVVVLEELNRLGVLCLLIDESAALRSVLIRWGDGEQNAALVPDIARGRITVWRQALSAGDFLDADSVGVEASPDGDGYILNGEASFTGQGSRPTRIWTLALIDEGADETPVPVSLLVAPDLHGIAISTARTVAPENVRRVTFDNVWVPRSDLVGEEGDGAAVITGLVRTDPRADLPTFLETETDALLHYAVNTESDGAPLSEEPVRQQLLVEAYIASRVMRLLRMRSAWARMTQEGTRYEDAQAGLWREEASQGLARTVGEVVGIHALLDPSDPRAAAAGRFERFQRRTVAGAGASSTGSVNEEVIANWLELEGLAPEDAEDQPGRDATAG